MDERNRRAERASSMSDEDMAEVFVARIRSGDLPAWHVRALARLGLRAAQAVFPENAGFVRGLIRAHHAHTSGPTAIEAIDHALWDSPGLEGAPSRRRLHVTRLLAVGAAKEVARLAYEPTFANVRASMSEDALLGDDPLAMIPLEILKRAAYHVEELAVGFPRGDHGSNEGYVALVEELVRADFGGEALMLDFVHASNEVEALLRIDARAQSALGAAEMVAWRLHGYLAGAMEAAVEQSTFNLPGSDWSEAAAAVRGAGWDPARGAYLDSGLDDAVDKYLAQAAVNYLAWWLGRGPSEQQRREQL